MGMRLYDAQRRAVVSDGRWSQLAPYDVFLWVCWPSGLRFNIAEIYLPSVQGSHARGEYRAIGAVLLGRPT